MSPWLIFLLVSLALVILLVIIGVLLCFYLTINDDFEAQPCSLTVIMNQQSIAYSRTIPVIDAQEAPTQPLLRPVAMSPMEIMDRAGKVWSFVETNRAVVDVRGSYGSFAPANAQDPYKLEHWSSPPASQSFIVTIYNTLGRRIVQFEYALQFVHSGSLQANEAYLDNVTIIPTFVSVGWGFKFNADVQVSSVRNVGTHDRPVAAVTIDQHYRLIGLNTVQRTDSFEVRGDGQWNRLSQSSRPKH